MKNKTRAHLASLTQTLDTKMTLPMALKNRINDFLSLPEPCSRSSVTLAILRTNASWPRNHEYCSTLESFE